MDRVLLCFLPVTDIPRSRPTSRRRRCLIVDDEPALIRGLTRLLSLKRPDWEILCAYSGPEAVELLDTYAFDVLMTDLSMPGMDGVTLLKIAQARQPGLVRVVHSSHIGTFGEDRVGELAHRCLAKPARPEDLLDVLDWSVASGARSVNGCE
jgi:two-component system response regulator YesN